MKTNNLEQHAIDTFRRVKLALVVAASHALDAMNEPTADKVKFAREALREALALAEDPFDGATQGKNEEKKDIDALYFKFGESRDDSYVVSEEPFGFWP